MTIDLLELIDWYNPEALSVKGMLAFGVDLSTGG